MSSPAMMGIGDVLSGHVTVSSAGTAVQLIATPTACVGVWCSALPGNTKEVTVGDSSAKAGAGTEQGVVLLPTGQPQFIHVNDASLLWVNAQISNEGMSFLIVRAQKPITLPTDAQSPSISTFTGKGKTS